MTAESTVPTPGGQPRDIGFSAVSVMPARTTAAGFRFPAGGPAARPASPVPLLAADVTAAVLGAVAFAGVEQGPLLLALLVATSVLLRPQPPHSAPGVLDELPVVCGRIAVTWAALAALVAAYAPAHALSARTLLLGFLLQSTADCASRGMVHWRRRTALLSQIGRAHV